MSQLEPTEARPGLQYKLLGNGSSLFYRNGCHIAKLGMAGLRMELPRRREEWKDGEKQGLGPMI